MCKIKPGITQTVIENHWMFASSLGWITWSPWHQYDPRVKQTVE